MSNYDDQLDEQDEDRAVLAAHEAGEHDEACREGCPACDADAAGYDPPGVERNTE